MIIGPVQDSHTNGYKELVEHEQEYEQGYSEVDQNVVYEEHYQETGEINGGHTETDHVVRIFSRVGYFWVPIFFFLFDII